MRSEVRANLTNMATLEALALAIQPLRKASADDLSFRFHNCRRSSFIVVGRSKGQVELSQLRLGEALDEIPFLDIFDGVPIYPEVAGHIQNRHGAGQLQGAALKGFRVVSTRIGQTKLCLLNQTADQALEPLNGQ